MRHSRSCLSDLWDSQSNTNAITVQCKEGNCDCPKACCALVFDPVLDIRISEKTMYETYSALLGSRMIFLTLGVGRDNSISKHCSVINS